jgi:hypothetical protein
MTRRWMRRVVLAACAVGAASAVAAAEGKPEKLLGLRVDAEKGELAVEVWSGGCTTRKDFRVDRAGEDLTVVRLRRDDCKMVPERATVTFTYAELGLKPHQAFTVRNPFTGDAFAASVR